MHAITNDIVAQAEKIRDSFILQNAHLPESINREGIVFVGFADESYVRQSSAFFDSFIDFLWSKGDVSFFFLWLEAPLDVTDASCGLSLHPLSDCERPTNFVRLQKSVPDEVLSGEAWFISSLLGRWAIYGEQYGSELAVFLASDHETAEKIRFAFKEILVDAVGAANGLGDPSDTDEGKAFSNRLAQNYRS